MQISGEAWRLWLRERYHITPCELADSPRELQSRVWDDMQTLARKAEIMRNIGTR